MEKKKKKMRIIGGKFKGKPIMFLKSPDTRPLKDSVKENIFNIILHSKLINVELKNSKILDLYSGVGSFGLEAISRGAEKVTFVEKNKEAINSLKNNINSLSIKKNIKLFESDINEVIKNERVEKFDFLFLDPPFKDNNFIQIIKLIKIRKLFNKKSIVIMHREKKTIDDFETILSVFLTKTYGKSKILFASF